jgi:hypothetical protein
MGEAAAVLHTSHDLSGEPARRGEALRDARWGNAPRRAEKARMSAERMNAVRVQGLWRPLVTRLTPR